MAHIHITDVLLAAMCPRSENACMLLKALLPACLRMVVTEAKQQHTQMLTRLAG